MTFRGITLGCLLFWVGLACQGTSGRQPVESQTGVDVSAILEATIQISMYEKAAQPGGTEAGGEGLGTVILYGSEILIVTHDHWSHLNADLNVVELRNSIGQLLMVLDGPAFRELIVYQEGGTMVLLPPAALDGLAPMSVGPEAWEGDIVLVVRRNPDTDRRTVEVVASQVDRTEEVDGQAKMQLLNLDGSGFLPGDSGGGVWADGRLVANTWASGYFVRDGVFGRLTGDEKLEPTNLAVVAVQPMGRLFGGILTDGLDESPTLEGPAATEEAHLETILTGE